MDFIIATIYNNHFFDIDILYFLMKQLKLVNIFYKMFLGICRIDTIKNLHV